MLTPQFPYKGNQIIISSGRVVVHAKDDAVFILGKQAVGISSPKTINLDSNEKILLNCSKIELGYKAESQGEPIILGKTFTRELNRVMVQLYIQQFFYHKYQKPMLLHQCFISVQLVRL